jgi:DNA-binding NarL/FixJ family response regulator
LAIDLQRLKFYERTMQAREFQCAFPRDDNNGVTMRILIADDSAVVRERLIEMLSDLKGVEIIGQAADGLEALNSIRKLKPDAVILDIQMPNGSGIDVLQRIKKKRRRPILIILTNYGDSAYRTKCMDAGADFFFDKSTQFDEVMKVLTGLI